MSKISNQSKTESQISGKHETPLLTELFQILVNQGVLEDSAENGNLPLPDFTPLAAKGQPTSEIIIEERGIQ